MPEDLRKQAFDPNFFVSLGFFSVHLRDSHGFVLSVPWSSWVIRIIPIVRWPVKYAISISLKESCCHFHEIMFILIPISQLCARCSRRCEILSTPFVCQRSDCFEWPAGTLIEAEILIQLLDGLNVVLRCCCHLTAFRFLLRDQ